MLAAGLGGRTCQRRNRRDVGRASSCDHDILNNSIAFKDHERNGNELVFVSVKSLVKQWFFGIRTI